MAKVFNLSGDVSLEDVNFSSTAARVQKNFDTAVQGIAQGSRQIGQSLGSTTVAVGGFSKAAAATGTSMKQFRAGLAGAGLQIQDFAVQVGSGQSALLAFVQQAPQLTSAFGPAGAALGTFVALAGAGALAFGGLGSSTSDAQKATDLFKAAQDAMSAAVDGAADSVRELRVEMDGLSASERSRALFSINDAISAQETALRGVAAAAREALEAEQILQAASVRPDEYAGQSPEMQANTDLARELVAELALIEQGGAAASEALTRMRTTLERQAPGDDSLTALNTQLLQLGTSAGTAEQALAELRDQLDRLAPGHQAAAMFDDQPCPALLA